MIIIDIEEIDFQEILNQISSYSDDAFKLALQNIFNKKISKVIEKQVDCFDIVVNTYISSEISFADIKKVGGLPIDDIKIFFKRKDIDSLVDINFPNEYKSGFYVKQDKKILYIEPMPYKIEPIVQKRAIKYKKQIQNIIIPSEKFIINSNIIKNCLCEYKNIFPIFKSCVREYTMWYCCICGKEYICSCFKNAIQIMQKKFIGGSITQNLKYDLQKTTFMDNICHMCRKIPSSHIFYLYGGKIGKYYLPYIMREQYEKNIDYKEAENNIRVELGIPKIGEGWVSQTQLYYTINFLFPEYEIQREASPEWLGRQRYDIYFPNEKLAIEYQGKQHYEPVNLFGGEEGYKNTIERDKEKLKKSKENGVDIIYISYKDKFDENTLYKRIKKYLENK
ncbi:MULTISPECIES: hypothetical protein [unclassified Campylobacter]|uniref:hypothetical protein n=1 Tax=unclassified Campylobacter TaxID=2593542 RepID=UPI0022E9E6B5|nr:MULTISPECIES: hypothetical protein [unclassified Campylobacter]MDA3054812.1 hypothetical protein [Campylobacter sp. VBCF_07 NA4]MDA3061155.1 hypothetical protein [Campylobacter sp. VBCF_02 NA5]MDA3070761.1 hypothetical protein [Campylobacter sp. VBCF_08 NA3]WBR54267.1 hypothetical protein PF027_08145 [Campylobacter sp. VBCF_01 NA2]